MKNSVRSTVADLTWQNANGCWRSELQPNYSDVARRLHCVPHPVTYIPYSINFYGISCIVNIRSTLVMMVVQSTLPPPRQSHFSPGLKYCSIAFLSRAPISVADPGWVTVRLGPQNETSFGFLMKLLLKRNLTGLYHRLISGFHRASLVSVTFINLLMHAKILLYKTLKDTH